MAEASGGRMVVVAMVLACVVLSSCGSADTTAGSASSERMVTVVGWQDPVEVPEDWGGATPSKLTSLHVADDDRTLVAAVEYVPVRLAERECAGELGGWTEDEGHPDVVWMMVRTATPNLLADPTLQRFADEFGACPVRRSTLELDLDAPLAGRDVMVDGERWVPGSDGYEPCVLPGCDPETGSGPEVADCADRSALVEDVRTMGDVPRHSDIGELRCEGGWAMVEVDIGSGACSAGDDSCAGQTFDRLFLQAGTPHWEVVGRTRDAGCGGIEASEPDFPTALCADRPAL